MGPYGSWTEVGQINHNFYCYKQACSQCVCVWTDWVISIQTGPLIASQMSQRHLEHKHVNTDFSRVHSSSTASSLNLESPTEVSVAAILSFISSFTHLDNTNYCFYNSRPLNHLVRFQNAETAPLTD